MPDLPARRRAPPSTSRGGQPSWTRPLTDRLTPAIKVLVIANAVLFAFYIFVKEVRGPFTEHLALGPGFLGGKLWQPVTSLFVHFDVLGFIFNLIGLWFVGAFIERTTGTRKFLQLFLGAGVFANIAIAAVAHFSFYRAGSVFDGASYAVLALFVAFGRMYGRAPTQILGGLFMQARHLAMMLVAWSVIADLMRADWPGLAGSLTATAAGYFISGGSFREIGDAVGGLSGSLRGGMRGRPSRRYKVLDGGQAPKRPNYWN